MRNPVPFLSGSKVALAIEMAVLIFAILVIYRYDLAIVANQALHSEQTSHVLAVPFILAYLIYRKKEMIKAAATVETSALNRKATRTEDVAGALLCVTAYMVYWYGSYTFNPIELHMISLPLFTAGLILVIFNSEMLRQLAFPISFLLFLTPPPSKVAYETGTILATISSEVAYAFLRTTGLPVTLSYTYGPPVIMLTPQSKPAIPFTVDLACSGVYSLTGFMLFSVFIAYISVGKLWKRAMIFLVGFPLIYALNIARIVSLVVIGYIQGAEAAMQAFHLLGGLTLTFLGTLILLFFSEKAFRLQIFTRRDLKICEWCEANRNAKEELCFECGRLLRNMSARISKKDIMKMLLLIIFVSSTILIQVPVFVLTEGPAETVLEAPSGLENAAKILPEISGYGLRFLLRDKSFENVSGEEASLIYLYEPIDKSKLPVWIGVEIGDSMMPHRWEICLISWWEGHGYQPRVTLLDQRDVQLVENPPLIARFLAFQWRETGQLQVILYWYEDALFKTNSSYRNKNVKISVVALGGNPQEYLKIEETLLPFGEAVANYWQPIKTWSKFSIGLSQYGTYLIAVSTVSLIIVTAFQTTRNILDRKSNLRIYEKLVPEEKLIIKAVSQASKGRPTLKDIAARYEELTGKQIDLNLLVTRLREAQEAGLLRRDLANVGDKPILVWKSLVPM